MSSRVFPLFLLPDMVIAVVIEHVVQTSPLLETLSLRLVCSMSLPSHLQYLNIEAEFFDREVIRIAFAEEKADLFLLRRTTPFTPIKLKPIRQILLAKLHRRKSTTPLVKYLINICDQIEASALLYEEEPRELHQYVEVVCDTFLANNLSISALQVDKLVTRSYYEENLKPNEFPITKSVPLPLAAALGWKTHVSHLISNGEDVNCLHPIFGHTLNAAAYQGKLELIQILVDNGVKWFHPSDWSFKHCTIIHGNIDQPSGFSPLSLAASAGHLEVIRLLIQLDLFSEVERGWSKALIRPPKEYHSEFAMIHAIRNNHADIFDFLLPRTRLHNGPNKFPWELWMQSITVAAACVDIDFMDRFVGLLKANTNFHQDSNCMLGFDMSIGFNSSVICYACQVQSTALITATRMRRLDILEFLVHSGFNIDAYQAERTYRAIDCVPDLKTLKCLHKLGSDFSLDSPAYPRLHKGGPRTSMKKFITEGKQDMFDYFMAHCNYNDVGWLGYALVLAASLGNIKCVKTLIEKGADPRGIPLNTYRFQNVKSPILAATENNHWEDVDYLKSCGVVDMARPPPLCECSTRRDPCYRNPPLPCMTQRSR
jgi:ankyrin repeat protein